MATREPAAHGGAQAQLMAVENISEQSVVDVLLVLTPNSERWRMDRMGCTKLTWRTSVTARYNVLAVMSMAVIPEDRDRFKEDDVWQVLEALGAHTGSGTPTRSVLIHDLDTTLDCRWLFNCCGVVHVLLAVASGLLLLLHHNRLAGTEKDRAKKLADRCTSLSFSVAWGAKTKLHAAASWCARTYCAVRGVHCAGRAAR